MTTTEWVWLLVGVIGLLLVGGALLGGVYLFVGDWRKSRARRGQQDYQPPESLPPAFPQSSPNETGIQWENTLQEETPPTSPGSERIRWGKIPDWEWTQVSPINSIPETDDESVKCPICRQKIDEAMEQVVECPQCGSLYHQRCLPEIDHVCSSCGEELS